MSSDNFTQWLRGFFELNGEKPITKEQAKMISQHLTLVFKSKGIK